MINAYEQGYYDDMRFFFSSLYGSALKDNPYLERAVLTGIHRIAKESIFSGLNNPAVCTVMSNKYRQYFGLTPKETKAILAYYDLQLNESVQAMYDGYRFGEQEIYNPWSIINYADNKKLDAYWINMVSNEILVQAMLGADQDIRENFEMLLSEGDVRVPVDLQTVCTPNQEVLASFRNIIECYGGFKTDSLSQLLMLYNVRTWSDLSVAMSKLY